MIKYDRRLSDEFSLSDLKAAPTRGPERFCLHAQEKKKHCSGPRVPILTLASDGFLFKHPHKTGPTRLGVFVDFASHGWYYYDAS